MRTRYLVATLVGAVALAGCGGSAETTSDEPIIVIDGADTSSSAPAASSEAVAEPEAEITDSTTDRAEPEVAAALAEDASDEERALAFADCLRDEGLEVDDPTVAADGSVDMSTLSDGNVAQLFGENEAAVDSCSALLDGGNFGPGASGFDQTEIQDQLVEFAGCLRDEGLDVRDPDISGGLSAAAGGPEALFGLDLQDPQYEAEVEACSDILTFAAGGQGA